MLDLQDIQSQLAAFAAERDWGQFHNPKNLACAIVVEAGELLEIFQWMTIADAEPTQIDPQVKRKVESELADIFIYGLQLADKLTIDIGSIIEAKMRLNEQRYPVEKSKGSARKYSDL
jgi:dCTP diphosphatase